MKFFISVMIIILAFGCIADEPILLDGFGKRPVYASDEELNDIRNLPKQNTVNGGPIFLMDTLLFITEIARGVHVNSFNLSDSSQGEYITFIKIPAITDFTISADRLYADSWTDLLTIDISEIRNVILVQRKENVFSPILAPPLYRGIFECVDLSKGAVLEWEDVILENVKCEAL